MKTTKPERCKHRMETLLPYREWHEDANRRYKLGQKQRFCPVCALWIWNYLWRKAKKRS